MIDTSTDQALRPGQAFDRLRRAVVLHIHQALAPLGLGIQQAALLRFLARHRDASLAEAARCCALDPAATTKAVEALLRRGWVLRQAHPTDRRRKALALTPGGRALAARADKVFDRVNRAFEQALSPAELRAFHQVLDKLQRAFTR